MAKFSSDDPRREEAVDQAFAKRMELACNNNRSIPPLNDGRITWLLRELKLHGMEVTLQTVHRWYHGTARPRHKKLLALAEVLKVDPSWLNNGSTLDVAVDRTRAINSALTGSVNVVMGFIQLAGWQCALPEEDDPNAHFVHFYSIIGGAQQRFHVSRGVEDGTDRYHFSLPAEREKCITIGLISKRPTSVELLHIPSSTDFVGGEVNGGYGRVDVIKEGSFWVASGQRIPVIKDFSKPMRN